MDLVGKVGKTDIAHELFANDGRGGASLRCWHERGAGGIGETAIGADIAVAGGGVGVSHLRGEEEVRMGAGERNRENYF